jgi:ribosome-associated protein
LARRAATATKDDARKLATLAARTAHHDNSEDIVILDLRGISQVTQYFVIATGTSDRQMRAVAEDICREAAQIGQKVWRVAGMNSGGWIVLDFVDVVVHIFDEAHRRYYDLELIWGDSPCVRWRQAPAGRRKPPATRE